MTMPEGARKLMEQRKTIALATCANTGTPNVVPMLQYWWHGEDELIIGDLFMKATRRNVQDTGLASFSVWDDESGEAYKFVGSARYETSGPAYELANANLHKKKPQMDFKGVVVIRVTEVYDASRGKSAGDLIAKA